MVDRRFFKSHTIYGALNIYENWSVKSRETLKNWELRKGSTRNPRNRIGSSIKQKRKSKGILIVPTSRWWEQTDNVRTFPPPRAFQGELEEIARAKGRKRNTNGKQFIGFAAVDHFISLHPRARVAVDPRAFYSLSLSGATQLKKTQRPYPVPCPTRIHE